MVWGGGGKARGTRASPSHTQTPPRAHPPTPTLPRTPAGLQLLGKVDEKFVEVVDVYEPLEDGSADKCFISKVRVRGCGGGWVGVGGGRVLACVCVWGGGAGGVRAGLHSPPMRHARRLLLQGYDATSHFETEIADVLDMYQRITGGWVGVHGWAKSVHCVCVWGGGGGGVQACWTCTSASWMLVGGRACVQLEASGWAPARRVGVCGCSAYPWAPPLPPLPPPPPLPASLPGKALDLSKEELARKQGEQ